MKFGKKKIECLEQLKQKFTEHGSYPTGYQLDTITKALAEVLGKTNVHINVPYSNFNCHGEAKKVAKDVYGLMPFSKERVPYDTVTTLYYGNNHITPSNYLPFQSEVDCFYIENIDTNGSLWVTIDLVKGPSWRAYL